tara:strand:+ start:395 stop:1000 length:606 start_codon:yes stop_codon:yes gene_type:complete
MESKKSNLSSISKDGKIFIVLGHEINQSTFELSFSSKKRCQLLASKFNKNLSDNYLIIFMGKGRLQGECKLSISECMFKFFCENFFTPKNYLLDKNSVDTIGDAIFSYFYVKKFFNEQKLFILTSDWHIKRTKYIFKKIYPKALNLNFIGSKEIETFNNKIKNVITKKEEKSLILLKGLLKTFDKNDYDLISFLKKNHDYY